MIGVGKKRILKQSKARVIGIKISKTARQLKVDLMSVMLLPELENCMEEFVELILAQYDLGKFKTKRRIRIVERVGIGYCHSRRLD